MKKFFAIFLAFAFLLTSCGGSSKKTSRVKYRKGTSSQRYYPYRGGDSIDDIIYSNLEHRRGSGIHYSSSLPHSRKFDIPVSYNEYVQKWIDYFTGPGRRHFSRYLERLGRFMPYIHGVLDHYGLPRDIVYLSMIESGFNIRARSWASAVGPWQFIRSTGAMYGLQVDYYIDERRDVQKSTHAAARHLRDLYDEFGHWYLAFAAYNAGAGKVRNAINKHGTNYWDMVEGRYLRQETKDYVPKILAAAIISKDPKKYGFHSIRYQRPIAFEKVRLRGATDLEVAGECAGVDPDLIRLLNPELLRDMTPPHIPNYELKIPKGTKSRFQRKYASLRPSQRVKIQYYTAEKWDTVPSIAREFGVSQKELAKANPGDIKVSKKRYTKKEKVRYRKRGKTRYRWKRKRYTVVNYSVRPGVRLTIPKDRSLAGYSSSRDDAAAYAAQNRFGVEYASLDRGSKKKKSKKEKKQKSQVAKVEPRQSVKPDLPALQTAKIPVRSDLSDLDYVAPNEGKEFVSDSPLAFKETPSGGDQVSPSNQELKAAVQKLQPISDEPDVESDPHYKKWVPEEESSQEVVKKSPPKKPTYHVVKRGETLKGISKKYGVSMSQLRDWNGKKVSPVLLSGAKIKVSETKGSTKQVASTKSPKKKSATSSSYYKVQPGDTLSQIARRQKVSVATLKALNGEKVYPVLQSGATIRIKGKAKPKVVKYKVKPGDNLTKIAKKHSTTPAKIKQLNGLKSHVIKPGAVLVVRGH